MAESHRGEIVAVLAGLLRLVDGRAVRPTQSGVGATQEWRRLRSKRGGQIAARLSCFNLA